MLAPAGEPVEEHPDVAEVVRRGHSRRPVFLSEQVSADVGCVDGFYVGGQAVRETVIAGGQDLFLPENKINGEVRTR